MTSLVLAALVATVNCDSISPTRTVAYADRLVIGDAVTSGRLDRLEARDTASGARLIIFYDSSSPSTARAYAPVLSAMYHRVACETATSAAAVRWHPVAFVSDSTYRPPPTADGTIWTIMTDERGGLTPAGHRSLFLTVPHEQAHATQGLIGARRALPRWYYEGQAEWVGLRVALVWHPDVATAHQQVHRAALLALADSPVVLAEWGPLRVTPSATRGQTPPFRFGPEDFLSDEAKTPARYAAACRLFELVFHSAGEPATRRWFRAVASAPIGLDERRLVELTRRETGVDISAELVR